MSDEHGWPDFSHSGEHGEPHEHGFPGEPADGVDSPFPDDLYDHDDPHDGGGGPDLDVGADPPGADVAWDDQHEPGTGHDEVGAEVVDVTEGHTLGPVGADPDAAPDLAQVSVFPPAVDVGPLPEPVDGFPWIDTGSLGLYHAGLLDQHEPAVEPVPAEDLAGYAAADLPPGVDPWAALADSDDPATSTLARWWNPDS